MFNQRDLRLRKQFFSKIYAGFESMFEMAVKHATTEYQWEDDFWMLLDFSTPLIGDKEVTANKLAELHWIKEKVCVDDSGMCAVSFLRSILNFLYVTITNDLHWHQKVKNARAFFELLTQIEGLVQTKYFAMNYSRCTRKVFVS